MNFKRLKNSIITKIGAILLSIILLLLVGSVFINLYGTNLISENIENNIMTVSTQNLKRIENEFSRLYYLESKIITDASLVSSIQETAVFSNYTKLMELLGTQDIINVMYQSSDYIEDMRLHMPEINRTITFNKGISDLNSDEFEFFTQKVSADHRQTSGLFTRNNKLFLVTVNDSFAISRTAVPNTMCVIELSNDVILKNLKIFSDNSLNENYILKNEEYILAGEDVLYDAILKNSKENPGKIFSARIAQENYHVVKNTSNWLGLDFICYIPHNSLFASLNTFNIILYSFVGLLIISFAVIMISMYKIIFKPIKELVVGFKEVENGNFGISLTRKKNDEFGYAFSAFNNMTENTDKLIKNEYQHTIAMQKANLKQLQAQINPHFLYNSFYILKHRMKSYDYENAIELADYLGDYFKFVTKEYTDFIPLKTEYEHAVTYMKIQLIRFRGKIQFDSNDIPQDYEDIMVPKLILQPILENAFVHGFDKMADRGFIHIYFRETGQNILQITIENSAKNITREEFAKLEEELYRGNTVDENISGLSNISLRLKTLYGPENGLKVYYRDDIFSVEININKENTRR